MSSTCDNSDKRWERRTITAAMICRPLPTCSALQMMSYSIASHPIPITFCIRTCQARLTFPINFVAVLTTWHQLIRLNFLMMQTLSSGCCTNTRTSHCSHCLSILLCV